MNARDEARLRAEVMLAYGRGEELQCSPRLDGGKWADVPPWGWPRWDWDHNDYRVKPKPLEERLVLNKNGVGWAHYTCVDAAQRGMNAAMQGSPTMGPFRIVHMREVTE